jgi:hypothetical protein
MICWYESERGEISKPTFFAEPKEYLGYWMTRQEVEMLAIFDIKVAQKKKTHMYQFIGRVNY